MFSNGLFEHADGRIQTKTLPSLAIPSALPIHRIMFRLTAYPISPKQATFIGLFAVCFWSSVIGLIRTLSLHMGPVGGAAVMYSLATILLLLIFGKPDLRRFSRNYLFWAGIFLSAANCACPFPSDMRTTPDKPSKSAWSIIYGRLLPSSARSGLTNSRQMVDRHRLCTILHRHCHCLGRGRRIVSSPYLPQCPHQSRRLYHGALGRAVLGGILHTDRAG